MAAEPPAAPIIVSALFADADQQWLDAFRRMHFPAPRNQVAAHLTLFHHLPPGVARELDAALEDATLGVPAPRVEAAGTLDLGRGVAIRIRSPGLDAIRARLAEQFAGVLVPQDRAGWRAHVTIQNKVPPGEARALIDALSGLPARPVALRGLASWYYRGGPWELRRLHRFGRPLNRSGRSLRS